MIDRSWAIFISGRGSNLQVLLDEDGASLIKLVVCNNPEALGAERAKKAGVPVYFTEKNIDWVKLQQQLQQSKISHIFLLGFMKILPAPFVHQWAGRIFNLHPSLLPKYPGLNAIERSYHDGEAMGVTIHHVVPEMDAGPIIIQRQVMAKAPAGRHSLTLSEAHSLISEAEHSAVRDVFRKVNLGQQ